jgi:hypothetical protein
MSEMAHALIGAVDDQGDDRIGDPHFPFQCLARLSSRQLK